jgi:hypothetical protein
VREDGRKIWPENLAQRSRALAQHRAFTTSPHLTSPHHRHSHSPLQLLHATYHSPIDPLGTPSCSARMMLLLRLKLRRGGPGRLRGDGWAARESMRCAI